MVIPDTRSDTEVHDPNVAHVVAAKKTKAKKKKSKKKKSTTVTSGSALGNLFFLIAPYISDATTLCRSACVCRAWNQLVLSNDAIWKALFLHRWLYYNGTEQIGAATNASGARSAGALVRATKANISRSNSNAISYHLLGFKQRYGIDMAVVHAIRSLSEPLLLNLESHLRQPRLWNDTRQDSGWPLLVRHMINAWLTRRGLAVGTGDTTLSDDDAHDHVRIVSPLQVLESLRICFFNDQAHRNNQALTTASQTLQQCMAVHVADHVHFTHIYHDLQAWAEARAARSDRQRPESFSFTVIGDRFYFDDDFGDTALYTGSVALSQILLPPEQLAKNMTTRRHFMSIVPDAIDAHLKRFTAHLQAAFPGDVESSTLPVNIVVNTLLDLMYDKWGFVGNYDDYFNIQNSSIYSVLKTKKGNYMSLVTIAVLILNRVGVKAFHVGLPHGQVLLGVVAANGQHVPSEYFDPHRRRYPTRDWYFDVFNRIRGPVTDEYCSRRFMPHEPWRDTFLMPMLPAAGALQKMLETIQDAMEQEQQQQHLLSKTVRNKQLEHRVGLWYNLLTPADVPDLDETIVATGITPLSLDRQIFSSHDLL